MLAKHSCGVLDVVWLDIGWYAACIMEAISTLRLMPVKTSCGVLDMIWLGLG